MQPLTNPSLALGWGFFTGSEDSPVLVGGRQAQDGILMVTDAALRGLDVTEVTVARRGRVVLEPTSLHVGPGEVLAVLGPNGAGKSTLMRGLLGLLPHGGTVTWQGQDLRGLPPAARARILAYVPQRSQLEAGLTVREVVGQGGYAAATLEAVDEALAFTDLEPLASRRFPQLSQGEQHRVLLARALATRAPVIVLDEPTAALDIGHALDFLALMRRLAGQGRAIIAVLHDLEEVRQVADRVLLLAGGRMQACGPVDQLLTAEHLLPVFGVLPVSGAAWGWRRP